MDILVISLRIVHILSGVFWLGVSFFNVVFLQPAVRATGGEGQKVMQHLMLRTRLTSAVYAAATLNLLSGLLLYGILFRFSARALTSPYAITLGVGGLAGVIAWAIALLVVRGVFDRMKGLGQAIQAQGGAPAPAQAAELQALGGRLVNLGQWAVAFLIVALLAMSVAQYVRF